MNTKQKELKARIKIHEEAVARGILSYKRALQFFLRDYALLERLEK